MRGLLALAIAPAFGVVVGYILGGRLSGFRFLRLTALWMVWLATFVQVLQYHVSGVRAAVEERLGVPMLAVVFGLVLLWLAANLRGWQAEVRIAGLVVALGAGLNGLVIALNGRMPYSSAAAASAGLPTALTTPKNEPVDPATRLAFLGDFIPFSPLRSVLSPGDLLIGVGVTAVVVFVMRGSRHAASDCARPGVPDRAGEESREAANRPARPVVSSPDARSRWHSLSVRRALRYGREAGRSSESGQASVP
ncbi:hypothetical protein Ga0074812_101179 [Parafrankia irregularis]|uniref:DUF5317 domain-containing protein n=1 Tax=Parafrankia irregularis TaxID=795642 RepID=A0A0S4QDZ9_9ACTN|nr:MULTISPECIES: DUF5317 family protein [Parafrankia]MBE3199652.1 DUF5317 family protein [Parafrankia sp. CH37]CUU53681.1 hypothetical protein Ga0074812_101179 [Parafrankia irregularis]